MDMYSPFKVIMVSRIHTILVLKSYGTYGTLRAKKAFQEVAIACQYELFFYYYFFQLECR